jgi:acetolactate synthase-1/2/3 large subunit
LKKTPLKPQSAIKEILEGKGDSIVVNDAGSHTPG